VQTVCGSSRIPYALLDSEPTNHAAWLGAAIEAVAGVLECG
jgi:hypothetical protein